MRDMRKLMQIVEGNEAETDKQKLDESVLGMVDVPSSMVGSAAAVAEERSREEYETHITKDSYAPHHPMGDVQMEDEDVDLDDGEEVEEVIEEIQVVHEEDLSDEEDEDEDCEVVEESEGQVDQEILDWMSRLDRLDGK